MTTPLDRRHFCGRCGWLAAGAAVGALARPWLDFGTPAFSQEKRASAEARLRELRLELPTGTPPACARSTIWATRRSRV